MFKFFKSKKNTEEVEKDNKISAYSQNDKIAASKKPDATVDDSAKEYVISSYVARLRRMRPDLVVRTVVSQYKLITGLYTVSLVLFLSGMYITWQKNLSVDVVYQRVDGVSIEIPNDARSRVLLTKVLQDAKVNSPSDKYRLTEDGKRVKNEQ